VVKFKFIKDLLMKYTFLLISVCFSFLSCKKDSSSDSNNSDANTQQLTSADWKYDSGGIGDANGNILFDFTSNIPTCSLDNTARFKSDGTGTIFENASVCQNASQATNFTWNFASNQTILNVSSGAFAGIGGSFKIKTLSGTQMTLLKDTTVTGLGSVTAVIKLKH
jgi:hypothetical protein